MRLDSPLWRLASLVTPTILAAAFAPGAHAAQTPATRAVPKSAPASAPAPGTAEQAARAAAAAEHVKANRFREAIALYETLLAERPADGHLRAALGTALVLSGDARGGIPHLQQALRADPSLAQVATTLGMAYLETGRAGDAIPVLRRAISRSSAPLEARRLLGDALMSAGRPAEAAREYRAVVERQPDDARGWYGLALAYADMTAETFDRLRGVAADSPYEKLVLADLAMAEDRPDRAILLYEEALLRLPALPGVRLALADAYEATGRDADAEAMRAREPSSAACTALTSECAFRQGRWLEAVGRARDTNDPATLYWATKACDALAGQAFERLEALPASPELFLVRAAVSTQEGRHPEAVELLKEASALAPANLEVRRRLAVALVRVRNHEEALPLVRGLIDILGDRPDLEYLLGDVLLQAQRTEEALRHLEGAVRQAPDLLPARAALGRAYVEAGRFAEAIPHLEAARPSDEDGAVFYQLARAYQATGRSAEASHALEIYRERQLTSAPPR